MKNIKCENTKKRKENKRKEKKVKDIVSIVMPLFG